MTNADKLIAQAEGLAASIGAPGGDSVDVDGLAVAIATAVNKFLSEGLAEGQHLRPVNMGDLNEGLVLAIGVVFDQLLASLEPHDKARAINHLLMSLGQGLAAVLASHIEDRK